MSERADPLDLHPAMVTVSYLILFAVSFVAFFLLSVFLGEFNYFPLETIWNPNPNIGEAIGRVWFIFLWGAGVTLLIGLILRKEPREHSPGAVFGLGTWLSINAGIFEELSYRWLRFTIAMMSLPVLNWLVLGFLPGSDGLLYWLYDSLLIPVANFTTFGALEEYLYHPASWTIGAAIISANGKFREAHEGNGWFNMVNAWFIGMVMFWLMFEYGLLTAIIVHVLYDVVIFAVSAACTTLQPSYYHHVRGNLRR